MLTRAATIPPAWSPGVASGGTVMMKGMSARVPGCTVYWATSAGRVIQLPTSVGLSASAMRPKEASPGVLNASRA